MLTMRHSPQGINKMITLTNIKEQFRTQDVKQVGSKQLFVVQDTLLVSYRTVVGVQYNNTWYLASCKYSATTSRQLSYFNRLQLYRCKFVYEFIRDAEGWYPVNEDGSPFLLQDVNKD